MSDGLLQSPDLARSILETAADAIIVIDVKGSIHVFNRAAERTFGYSADEVVGKNISMLMPEPHRSAHDGYLDNYVRTGEAKVIGIGRETQGRRKDGTDFPLDLSISEFASVDGQRLFTGLVRDISEKVWAKAELDRYVAKLAEGSAELERSVAELEETRDALRHLSDTQRSQLTAQDKELEWSRSALEHAQRMEALGRLAGGIAHDFNNLMAVIAGFAGMVRDDLAADDPSQEDVDEILRATASATELTRQLLVFSRKTPNEPESLDLNQRVADALRMLRRTVGERVEVVFEPSDSRAVVRIDPGRLDQVIVNLAVNARDAMPSGGTLHISVDLADLAPSSGSAPYVRLRVRDTGKGVPQDLHERIFEPFFTTKGAGQGTGLGLAICFSVIADAGGVMRLDSEADQGATFDVFLPLSQHAVTPFDPRSPSEVVGAETVLIAEDDDALRRLLVRVLRRAGYTVYEAANGDEALAKLEQLTDHLDALITDVVMPGVDGIAVYEKAGLINPRAARLLITGYLESDSLSDGEFDGQVLWKPFAPHVLLERLRQQLDAM